MRILMVSHGYPPFAVTGVERVTEQSARALTASGHSVTVLSRRPTAAPPLPRAERSRSIDSVDVVMVAGGAAPSGGPFPGFYARMEQIFERLLLEVLPDVVVIAHLTTHSPGYVSIAHRWNVPVVMELHDFYTVCERAHLQRPGGARCAGPEGGRACAQHCFAGQHDALERWALRTLAFSRALGQADALIAPSRFVADYFSGRHGLSGAIQVVPNGIAFEVPPRVAPPPSEGPLRLASLGPVTQHKGAHVVVQALRLARLPRARYTLFGGIDPQYASELRTAVEQVAGLELRLHGRYQPGSLPTLLSGVDALVIGSVVWETFSIVAREAMACGVPVIAPRLGGLPEAIRDWQNGVLYEADSSAELAAVLQRLDADRSALARLGTGIERSDWITVGERTRRLEGILMGTLRAGARAETDSEREETRTLRALIG
jgi:glycosyltransferase involved in cell wall biosynthesis